MTGAVPGAQSVDFQAGAQGTAPKEMSVQRSQEWHRRTELNMLEAHDSHSKALKQCIQSQKAREEVTSDNFSMYSELRSTLEQKVGNTHRIISKLESRAVAVVQSIKDTSCSLHDLELALQNQQAPMQLCIWRIRQRELRPLHEQIRDSVEVALEAEKAMVLDVQRRLGDAIKRTRATMSALESKLQEIRQDVSEKSQALGVDELCLRTTQTSFQVVLQRTASSLRSLSSSRQPSSSRLRGKDDHRGKDENNLNEVARHHVAVRLAQTAVAHEDAARVLREENSKLIGRCSRAGSEALAKLERSLKERINESQQLRKRLEFELKETGSKIDRTKRTITETQTQIRSLGEPMDLCSNCASWRKQRGPNELISDPVSRKLQEHQATLLRSHEELRGQQQSENRVLQDLQDRFERLQEDLKGKTDALRIDLCCLQPSIGHEAQKASGGGPATQHSARGRTKSRPLSAIRKGHRSAR